MSRFLFFLRNRFYLLITIILLFFATNCKNSSEHKIKKSDILIKSTDRKFEYINSFVNKKFKRKKWDFYISTRKKLPDEKNQYPVYVFLSKKFNGKQSKSLLIVGKNKVTKNSSPILVSKIIKGIVDEVNIVRLGALSENHLLLINFHKKTDSGVFSTTEFWDLNKGKLNNLWSITSFYDPEYRETYNPPEFHYWDGNDDGIREIILTNSWPDKTKPPPWKYRWAVFSWNSINRNILPVRGLMLNRFKDQNPLWLAMAALEAGNVHKEKDLIKMYQTHAACDNSNSLTKIIEFKKWIKISSPKFIEKKKGWSKVSVNVFSKTLKYKLIFEFNRLNNEIKKWRICRLNLFQIKD